MFTDTLAAAKNKSLSERVGNRKYNCKNLF